MIMEGDEPDRAPEWLDAGTKRLLLLRLRASLRDLDATASGEAKVRGHLEAALGHPEEGLKTSGAEAAKASALQQMARQELMALSNACNAAFDLRQDRSRTTPSKRPSTCIRALVKEQMDAEAAARDVIQEAVVAQRRSFERAVEQGVFS